jgi:hypothetical protein
VAAFEVGDDTEDDEEAATCNTLERGLAWERRVFGELILLATSVSFPCASNLFSNFAGSFERCGSPSTCTGQTLATFGRRRACTTRELRAEWAQLEMQLVVAQVAATTAVASEASMRTTLEAAKQSVEDRATAAQSAAAIAVTERDALASRLALAEAEVEKLHAAAMSAEEATKRARTAASTT